MGQELLKQQQEMKEAILAMERSDRAEDLEEEEGSDEEEDAWVESGLRALQTNLKEYSVNNQSLMAKIQNSVSGRVCKSKR